MSLIEELRDESASPARMRTLSDSLFAIVLTFLMFRLEIPKLLNAHSDVELWFALKAQAGILVGYSLSFFIIASFWVLHQRIFRHVTRVNRAFLWLNFQFLFWVSLLPLSTSLHSSNPTLPTAWVLYATNISVAGLSILSLWLRIGRQQLWVKETDPRIHNYYVWRISIVPFASLISIPIAFQNVSTAQWFPVLVPVGSLLIDRLYFRSAGKLSLVVNENVEDTQKAA
jgi:uncharacterized membrane protein